MEAHPRQAEHSPYTNRFRCPPPRVFALAKLDAIVVYVVPRWRGGTRRSDLWVLEARILLLRDEASNLTLRGCPEPKECHSPPDMRTS